MRNINRLTSAFLVGGLVLSGSVPVSRASQAVDGGEKPVKVACMVREMLDTFCYDNYCVNTGSGSYRAEFTQIGGGSCNRVDYYCDTPCR